MRYGLGVTDFTHQDGFHSLPAAEGRLAATFARPRRIALGCIVALTALGWLGLGLMTDSSSFSVTALCRPNPAADLERACARSADVGGDGARHDAADRRADDPDLCGDRRHRGAQGRAGGVAAGPDRGLCRGLARLRARRGVAAMGARARALLDRRRLRQARCSPARCSSAPALYQFSALKRACVTQCQRPFPFFFANWTARAARRVPARPARRGSIASAAAGR